MCAFAKDFFFFRLVAYWINTIIYHPRPNFPSPGKSLVRVKAES